MPQIRRDSSYLPSMKPIGRSGRVQKAIRRAFRARPGQALSSRELLTWTHPRGAGRPWRDRCNHYRAIRAAAKRMCVRVGRRWPHGTVRKLLELPRWMRFISDMTISFLLKPSYPYSAEAAESKYAQDAGRARRVPVLCDGNGGAVVALH
jgi:hypothetical protein